MSGSQPHPEPHVVARPLLRPRPLPRGGLLGVCAPAGPIPPEQLRSGLAWLQEDGFRARCSAHVEARQGYLAGSDQQRREDFLSLVRDPEVDAIVLARGGYGTARWLPDAPIDELRDARKLVIGHSDATALALHLYRSAGLASIHGPMLQRADITAAARERLWALACGEPAGQAPLAGKAVRAGRAEGPLLGGNLKLIAASLGTPWEIQLDGAILFLEDVAEQPYAIDRSLTQLRNAGKLERLAGVAVGQFVDCESPRYPETTSADVLRERLESAFQGPIVADLPFGHVADNHALPIGTHARIDGGAGTLTPLEAAVAEAT